MGSTLDLGTRSNSVLPCSFPMSTNERGCWSCRARRKRCDGRTPRCNTCDRLGIDCAGFGSSRPNWMDGGVQQRAYCGWLKNVVKSARRQQSHTQRRLYSDSSSNFSQTQQSPLWLASPTSPVEIAIPDTAPYQVQTPWTDPGPSSSLLKADPRIEYWLAQSLDWETNTELFSPGLDEGDLGGLNCTMPEGYFDTLIADPQQDQASPPSPKQGMPNLAELSQGNADCEPDWLLLMRYFDCTMQRLFPFHCQVEHIDERGYMLHLAHRSSIVRIALISTVSYDFEQLWTDAQPQHADAKASATNSRWLTYYHQASELIQPELETLFSNNNHTSPNSRHNLALEALVSLVHLLLLGVSWSKSSLRQLIGTTAHLLCFSVRSRRQKCNKNALSTGLSSSRASRFYNIISSIWTPVPPAIFLHVHLPALARLPPHHTATRAALVLSCRHAAGSSREQSMRLRDIASRGHLSNRRPGRVEIQQRGCRHT